MWVVDPSSHVTQTIAKTTSAEAKRVAWSSLLIDLIHQLGRRSGLMTGKQFETLIVFVHTRAGEMLY
jgi:hypothetical protein